VQTNQSCCENKSKCSFDRIVLKEVVKVDSKKIVSIIDWKKPNTITLLCGFLGIMGYYRRFVKIYAKIVALLTSLLKKYTF
jgi:hypothetical protein